MRRFFVLFYSQMQTLGMFVLFLAFIYFPNLNIEINLLPFQINNISWRAAWYYIVIFILVWLFIYLRVSIVSRLFEKFCIQEVLLSNLAVVLLGIPFLFVPHFRLFSILMLFFAFLLISIDFFVYKSKYTVINFMYIVVILFFAVNNILLFVSWQNDYNQFEYSSYLVNNYRMHDDWRFVEDDWSVVKYSNSMLIDKEGDFDYPTYYDFEIYKEGFNYVLIREQAEHFVYSYDGDVYVAGVPSWNPFYRYVVNLTYLFALYLVITFLVYYFYFRRRIYKSVSFFSRLQSTLAYFFIGTMLVVFVSASVMIVTRHERNAIYNQQYRMSFLVKYFTPILQSCSDCKSLLKENVAQLADMLDVNISLYGAQGNLFISEGVEIKLPDTIDDLNDDPFYNMPARSYARMIEVGGRPVVQSYAVIVGIEHKPIYIVMSSFSEVVKLNRNLTLFFVLMFNLFILTMIVTSILSYLISRRLSAPLSLLEKKMSEIELGAENEKIDYPIVEGDVLSMLVSEYNMMIDKLAVSVEELAQSEREASWRQMARQMAHEIKNPLTPMQLLTQRLLMQSSDNFEEYKESVRSLAKALLQGIESITTTTDALSNFAKTPISPLEPINIVESVKYTVDLFRNNEEHISIEFSSSLDKAMVLVDKEMIGHVFNNLLKNAIQAIPEGREGKISVKIYHNITDVIVSVCDNGVGILEENRDKLFNVNFTTKTKGMGLGLLIVKNVVDQAKGSIRFNSVENEGTTFIVSFPFQK